MQEEVEICCCQPATDYDGEMRLMAGPQLLYLQVGKTHVYLRGKKQQRRTKEVLSVPRLFE